jgi:threonine/homoserine/homoserine lactone efflux protein
MAAGCVLALWIVAVLLIVVPGADWAFTIGAALRGRLVGPAVGGLVVGYTAMTLVVAAGVGTLVAGTPAAMTVLTVAGGLYLIGLGAKTLADPAGPIVATGQSDGAQPRSGWLTLARGIGVSGLNPKGLLLFIALLPQFTDARWDWPIAVQVGLLGLVFTLTCAAFYTTIGFFARAVLHARPTTARLIRRGSGVGMVVVGASLLIERLAH